MDDKCPVVDQHALTLIELRLRGKRQHVLKLHPQQVTGRLIGAGRKHTQWFRQANLAAILAGDGNIPLDQGDEAAIR